MLAGVADAVLPAVLSLLRSRSREVIKAVLGFVKVRLVHCAAEVKHVNGCGCLCSFKALVPVRLCVHSVCIVGWAILHRLRVCWNCMRTIGGQLVHPVRVDNDASQPPGWMLLDTSSAR